MQDYREHKSLYIYIGLFVAIVAMFTIAYKATSWLIWAHQCINAAL